LASEGQALCAGLALPVLQVVEAGCQQELCVYCFSTGVRKLLVREGLLQLQRNKCELFVSEFCGACRSLLSLCVSGVTLLVCMWYGVSAQSGIAHAWGPCASGCAVMQALPLLYRRCVPAQHNLGLIKALPAWGLFLDRDTLCACTSHPPLVLCCPLTRGA
jgi:hypothetical protein